jgi:putative membrane protein
MVQNGMVYVKALHIVAVISWMAALLYLPRLFVYHSELDPVSSQSRLFAKMEDRLLRFIANPAMIAVWCSGSWMAFNTGLYHTAWLQTKIVLVVCMSGFHGYFRYVAKLFESGGNRNSSRFYRVINEGPTILMIGIVFLVVVRPFS